MKNSFLKLIGFTGKKISRGFSLVELMVVMVIVGVMLTVAVPAYKRYQGKARLRAHEATLNNLYNAALVLDSADELPDNKGDAPGLLIKQVKGLNSSEDIDFQYGGDKNTWCISYDQTKEAKNLKACINQDGELLWGHKNDSKKGVCSTTSGACSGEEKPQAL